MGTKPMDLQMVICVVPAAPDQSAAFRFPANALSVEMVVPVEELVNGDGWSPELSLRLHTAMIRLARQLVEPGYVAPPLPPDILDHFR